MKPLVSVIDIFSGMDQIKTGVAIYNEGLNLVFANETIRGYLPHLYEALDQGLSMKAAIKAQTLEITPELNDDECERRTDYILSMIRNCGTLEVVTAEGNTLKSTYDKTSEGLYVITTTDVSNHKATEKELLRAREEAERANAAKSKFLAHMSHEIRTPMSGVFMAAQLLQTRLRMANLTEMGDLADILISSANHLSAIIDDVLNLSKIESGLIDINPTENSLADMLVTFKKSQDFVAKEIGLDLKLVIDPKLPDRLIYDSVRLTQCITNLVTNALKFTTSGSVTVAVLFDPQTYVVTIHVVDTGMGIALNEQDQVFGEFKQATQDLDRAQKGTGLGLTISRKLARLMGGDITLTSKVGKGSIFTLTFASKPVERVQDIARVA
jgi:signal transduction histidine kinase